MNVSFTIETHPEVILHQFILDVHGAQIHCSANDLCADLHQLQQRVVGWSAGQVQFFGAVQLSEQIFDGDVADA